MKRSSLLVVRLILPLLGIASASAREPCSPEKVEEVRASPYISTTPSRVEQYVDIDCNLTLEPTQVVEKTLVMTGEPGSGVTIDCKGATIRGFQWSGHEAIIVSSRIYDNGRRKRWRGASNVTVRNCHVEGRVRVGGGGPSLLESSYHPDHTQRIQQRSPKDIVFDNLHIKAKGEVPFYVFPGALRVTLMNSEISGDAGGPAIYLDAESAENVIRDNVITARTRREHIAIDGSARNLIVDNRLSGNGGGAIAIYRNCGEDTKRLRPRKGVIRHQYPTDNVILDNIFDYRGYRGNHPAVAIASRQGDDGIGYCGDDENDIRGQRLGSQIDNDDHAYRTVVAENRFIGPVPGDYVGGELLIKINDDPSYVFGNTQIVASGVYARESPCYVENGYPTPMLASGQSIQMFDDGSGPRCTGQRLTCNAGRLTTSRSQCRAERASNVIVRPFGCSAESNNRGCSGRVSCPRQTVLAGLKAACNLESGSVTDEELSRTPWSFAGVVKRSKNASEGVCVIDGVDVSERGAVLGGRRGPIEFSCREHDDNGGDCHVRGAIACRSTPVVGPSQ
jgi:hypothetical protein